jgi:glycerate dehydrogenase
MKIVVLDGYALNPGDLSWELFEAMGHLTVYPRTPPELVVERAKDAAIILTNKTRVREKELALLPRLKYVGVLATGYDVVDTAAARRRGIVVTNVPTYGTQSVAQLVFALLLELCHHVQEHNDAVKKGAWSACADYCFWNYPLIELAGKKMGIIGFGRIGRQTAAIAAAFGMELLVHSRSAVEPGGLAMRVLDRDTLLGECDVLSLHCPLTPDTAGLICEKTLSLMKPSAFLINTARGGLIVDQDLAEALNRGRIAGAALDVLSVEPPPADNPLLAAANCIITPHIAWATYAARTRLMRIAAENLKAFLAGNPVHVVS